MPDQTPTPGASLDDLAGVTYDQLPEGLTFDQLGAMTKDELAALLGDREAG
jgi:hypothetical protein